MEFDESFERSQELARQAVELLASHNLPANPVNLTIWYLYVSGRVPALNEELDETLATRGTCTPEKSLELYRAYYQDDVVAGSQRASSGMQSILARLITELREMSSTNEHYGSALENAQAAIANKTESVGALLESLLILTRETLENNRGFQGALESHSQEVAQLRTELERTQRQAMTDPLTGLLNRRAFDIRAEEILSRGTPGTPIALLVIDIDYFKKFNDSYGHSIGDQVLRAVGQQLQEKAPAGQLVARYGGEEFVVLINDCGREQAKQWAEAFRETLSKLRLRQKQTGRYVDQVTVSIGVAVAEVVDEPEAFFDSADAALYEAKAAGRDRVVFASWETVDD